MKCLMIRAIAVIASTLLLACTPLPARDTTPECPELPSTFRREDLVGTWAASYSLNDSDLLLVRGDGTCKQIYDDPDAGRHYESGWLKWDIEFRESNFARLHLNGMRRAGDLDSIFNRESGGVDPELFTAIDYCENEVVKMPDGVVLIVTGATYVTPRGIVLRQTRLAGSEWTWSFELMEE